VSIEGTRVGDRAPSFRVETTDGPRDLHTLLADGSLVLVFYTEDATPTCTQQVTSFSQEHETFAELGASVLAVSADSMESHERFAQRMGGLPFPLAADPDLELARAFGVVGKDGTRSRRAVFVIDEEGVVREALLHYHPGAIDQFAAVFGALGLEL
jgi:peroxiredoxin Q/BCP